MAPELKSLILPVRIAQAVLGVLVLGLLAYVANISNRSPSQVNFLIFTSVWAMLAVAYIVLTPKYYPVAAHKFGLLFAEAVTMLFWFAGFIALAVLLTDIGCKRGGACGAAIAGDVFAAFEWVLFSGTTILAASQWAALEKETKPEQVAEAPAEPFAGV